MEKKIIHVDFRDDKGFMERTGSYPADAQWDITIEMLPYKPRIVRITWRGTSADAVILRFDRENVLVLPGWEVCSKLADLDDISWNSERLEKNGLGEIDAISIATAIANL